MNSSDQPIHPGKFVKLHVIPKDMSVTRAAKLLGIGRPALSNFLNGKVALSIKMAERLERAFGADQEHLMNLQRKLELSKSKNSTEIAATIQAFVPSFLRINANEIEIWANKIQSRSQLAVLLRILVNSTNDGITFIDFPGNDDAERPGWDGKVETQQANPWVPNGASGWEFGTNSDVKRKADKDYQKRTESISKSERREMTYVFVTPRRWKSKQKWLLEHQADGNWKRVLVWDANDLEQWLEQSIPGQTWFMEQLRGDTKGVKSLDRCWREWSADCEPEFSPDIFHEACSSVSNEFVDEWEQTTIRMKRIVANSIEEGLAFLSVWFSARNPKKDLAKLRDRVVIFTEIDQFTKLAAHSNNLIPVVVSPSIESEVASSGWKFGGVVIEPQTASKSNPDVKIELLSHQAFTQALIAMELNRDRISQLAHHSGRSLTVLRRLLSANDALRNPSWSSNQDLAQSLIAFMLGGSWNKENSADRDLMCWLTGYQSYEQVEKCFLRLKNLVSSPVWVVGTYRGVISKIDTLFTTHAWIEEAQIDRFLDVADLVLSERDPSLDLTSEKRWAASIYGKQREISSAFRSGIAESLVLLAIHGNECLEHRIGRNIDEEINRLVTKLLIPLDIEKLKSQSSNLPLYAEAAPDTFLNILENEIRLDSPVFSELMKSEMGGISLTSDRSSLLWSLEILAWDSQLLPRVVDILGHLCEMEPIDNLMNKASSSLLSIFRGWLPQTAANVEERILLFNRLSEKHPKIAWIIAKEQFEERGRKFGWYNEKPKTRQYAIGYGLEGKKVEYMRFVRHCIGACLSWPNHTKETLYSLIENLSSLERGELHQLDQLVKEWVKLASDEDLAWLREQVRVALPSRKVSDLVRCDSDDVSTYRHVLAEKWFADLEPKDLLWKHAWLFKTSWVEESQSELDEDLDSRGKRILDLRNGALKEVHSARGYEGVLRLAFLGTATNVVGNLVNVLCPARDELRSFVEFVLRDCDLLSSPNHQNLIQGILESIEGRIAIELIQTLQASYDKAVVVKLFCLARFERYIWDSLETRFRTYAEDYWRRVVPSWGQQKKVDLNYVATKLLWAKRADTSFAFVRANWNHVESDLIFRILVDLASREERELSRLESIHVRKAIKVLTERNSHDRTVLVRLEMTYLDIFLHEEGGIPNLEKEIEDNPDFYCDLISWIYKPKDQNGTEQISVYQGKIAAKLNMLLEKLACIPGRDERGNLSESRLEEWVGRVQDLSDQRGYREQADFHIGCLLSKTPKDETNEWPCEPVRKVMEKILIPEIESGIWSGKINSRGFHLREKGGKQEREIANEYTRWATSCEYTYPRVAAMLNHMAKEYERLARSNDLDDELDDRLG